MTGNAKVRTRLWFDQNGEDAARFYVSLLPGGEIESCYTPDASKPPLIVNFSLFGAPYQILNGGPHRYHSEAASISVLTDDQAETDRLWAALTSDGSAPVQYGWLKDSFGLSWQIVPRCLTELLSSSDTAEAARVMQAMIQVVKIDIVALEAAAEQTPD